MTDAIEVRIKSYYVPCRACAHAASLGLVYERDRLLVSDGIGHRVAVDGGKLCMGAEAGFGIFSEVDK